MKRADGPSQVVHFGVFEVDLRAGEVRKNGLRVRLQEQPFAVLATLLERPGEVVTREELQKKLWSGDTFVDFDTGINTSIKKIREALGDSADNPRFVETLPRRGYRFVAPIEGAPVEAALPRHRPASAELLSSAWRHIAAGKTLRFAGIVLAVAVATLLTLNVGGWRDRVLGGASPSPIESLAVLPLDNLSGDPEQEYFADGMTDALIAELGQISALRVISRRSVMRYKGLEMPLPEIARELNVDAVVEGTVLRSGERVRITAQLIGAKPERHLWAETFDRDIGDVLALHSDVAQAIARKIEIAVTPQEQARLAGTRPVNLQAHEAYLKGQYFIKKGTREDVQRAFEFAQQAIEIDPGYAPAYALLAYTYHEGGWRGVFSLSEVRAKAMAAARKALEIDDTLAEAHTWLGTVLYIYDWDWAAAEREFKRAIELNPNSALAHGEYSWYLMVIGRSGEALREAKRGQVLDPLSIEGNTIVGHTYTHAGKYVQALEEYQKALQMYPNSGYLHGLIGEAHLVKGRYDEAIAEYEKAVTLSPGIPCCLASLGHAYAMAGRRGEALKTLDELRELSKRGIASPYDMAIVYAGLGQKDQAFEWLEKAYEEREWWLAFLKVGASFDPLRSDPRFQDLLCRMNFPE